MSLFDPDSPFEEARCRSCGARIVWVVTDEGKRTPVDAVPQRRFVPTGSRVDGTPRMRIRPTYVSHFALCPDAGAWRRSDGRTPRPAAYEEGPE